LEVGWPGQPPSLVEGATLPAKKRGCFRKGIAVETRPGENRRDHSVSFSLVFPSRISLIISRAMKSREASRTLGGHKKGSHFPFPSWLRNQTLPMPAKVTWSFSFT
jgi:hypothetical protein